jgi:hypothetical protein
MKSGDTGLIFCMQEFWSNSKLLMLVWLFAPVGMLALEDITQVPLE